MTLKKCKDKAAKEKGHDSFVNASMKYFCGHISFGQLDMIINRAMQLYKSEKNV